MDTKLTLVGHRDAKTATDIETNIPQTHWLAEIVEFRPQQPHRAITTYPTAGKLNSFLISRRLIDRHLSPRSTTTVSPQPTLRRPSRTSWESDSKSRLTVVPSALTEARNYAPPEMHYQSSRTESVYATLPRTSYSRATAITTETYSSTSAAVSSYATLPRKTRYSRIL